MAHADDRHRWRGGSEGETAGKTQICALFKARSHFPRASPVCVALSELVETKHLLIYLISSSHADDATQFRAKFCCAYFDYFICFEYNDQKRGCVWQAPLTAPATHSVI